MFVFRLQEEVAAGTDAMKHIKLLQGLTLVVQSAAEVPFMFLCGEWCATECCLARPSTIYVNFTYQ